MSTEEDIENAAAALWKRDREDIGLPPMPWEEAGERAQYAYRRAVQQ